TVREIRVETGYTSSVDGFTITNTHEPFTKEINVTKIWNDNNSSLRPESVTVHLMDGDNVVATVSLSADNDWKATFKDLPVNRDGKAIVYTVKEVEVPDYTTEVKDCCGNFKIVNTPIVVPINVTVNKVWNDNNNNDGIRPGSVTIRLLADGEVVEVAVITGDDWTYTFTDLPEYKDGKKVTYTVEEVEVPSGYVASVDGLTITNKHNNLTKNITVSKFWDDDNNNDGKRPGSVTIRLLADGNEVATATLSDDNDWKHIFEDLPVNKDGKVIVYNVTEDSVDPYVVSITNVDDEFIVTNSYNITKINLTVNKVWVDEDDNDGLRPDNITVILYADGEELVAAVVGEDNDWTYTFSDLQKYNNGYLIEYTIDELPVDGYVAVVDGLTITNTHDIITKDIPVSKVWVDNNNNDGTRPDSVTVNLYAFGRKVSSISITEADGWEGVFKDLPVYIKGNEIVYTIVEESVPDYWVTYNGSMIINTHDLVNTSVTVTKVWNDSNNNDGVRPDSVSVNLYADGVKVSSIVLSSNNSWTHTFDKLPKYNDGQIINYTVDEEVVGAYSVSITEDSNYFIIVNNYETELINLTINKIWDDKDNYYGKRPVNVTVKVFADGEEIDSVVLSEENNWSCELNNLPKYDNGKLINYSVDEVNITYYHYSIDPVDDYTFTVTNTLNKVRVFKWAWKLIGWNESYYERVEVDDNVPVVKRSSKVYAKGKGIGKYQPRYRAPYRNKNHISKGKHYINRLMFREHYRLFIYLYNEYLYGNMTYSEFVALLQLNGIQIDESNAWDSNGTLIFDYDDLEDVPDSIGLHDNGGHVKDSSDRVEKYKPISNSGVIDSGEVVAEVFDVEE
ncbi:MAG: Cna B-type domain-containing protein, partial [Methanosphaera sp.]|nr:Cna B-type domain-containing protein [Methanosphaera sp.]